MFESFQSVCANTTYACAAGVGVVVVAYGAVRGMKFLSGGVKCVTAVSLAGSLIIGGMVVTNTRYAAAKTNDTQQVGSDTNQMEKGELRMENAGGAYTILHSPFSILHSNSSLPLVRVENWYRRGAWEDGKLVRFDEDWCFPLASNHLTSVELWSQGKLFASERDELPFAALTTPLALVPRESEVFFGRTASNSYRFEWVAAHPNRDAAVATNAAIEIFRNGDFEITEGGVTTRHPYEVPFAHDGFGQDDDWAMPNVKCKVENVECA